MSKLAARDDSELLDALAQMDYDAQRYELGLLDDARLYALDLIAAADRAGSEHEETLIGNDWRCAQCGSLLQPSRRIDLAWHPAAPLSWR